MCSGMRFIHNKMEIHMNYINSPMQPSHMSAQMHAQPVGSCHNVCVHAHNYNRDNTSFFFLLLALEGLWIFNAAHALFFQAIYRQLVQSIAARRRNNYVMCMCTCGHGLHAWRKQSGCTGFGLTNHSSRFLLSY